MVGSTVGRLDCIPQITIRETIVTEGHKQLSHRSTKADERYYHHKYQTKPTVGQRDRQLSAVTAFARQDKDGTWYVAYAECDSRDQFCRRVGRNVARRKWFAGKRTPLEEINYESALAEYI